MPVSTGDNITASDYNTLANNLNKVWADIYSTNTPSSAKSENTYGWGQANVSTVAIGDAIDVVNTNHLINRINLAVQQTGTGSTITKPVSGDLITASEYNSIENEISTQDTNHNTAVNTTTSSAGADGTKGRTSWSSSAEVTITHTFTSFAEARYFFNSGGQLRYSFTNNGTTNDAIAWQDLFDSSDMGTLIFSINDIAQTGTRAGTITAGSGFYELSTTPTEWYSISLDISPYTDSNLKAKFSRNAAGDTITTTFTLTNAATAFPSSGDDVVDGTTTVLLDSRIANSASSTNPTVNFAITAPTYNIGTWSGS